MAVRATVSRVCVFHRAVNVTWSIRRQLGSCPGTFGACMHIAL